MHRKSLLFKRFSKNVNDSPHAILDAVESANVDRVLVGPGCYRRDLPPSNGIRTWIVEIEQGAQWPYVDCHDAAGESVYVLEGELIEGERRFSAGSFIQYAPFSRHQPRSETGVRLFGYNAPAPENTCDQQ